MCRSIKQLRDNESPTTDQEVAEAALQYVRKVTGFRSPSRANRESFDLAVAEVAAATHRVLTSMADSTGGPPQGRAFHTQEDPSCLSVGSPAATQPTNG